jgi:hypothetical protein
VAVSTLRPTAGVPGGKAAGRTFLTAGAFRFRTGFATRAALRRAGLAARARAVLRPAGLAALARGAGRRLRGAAFFALVFTVVFRFLAMTCSFVTGVRPGWRHVPRTMPTP